MSCWRFVSEEKGRKGRKVVSYVWAVLTGLEWGGGCGEEESAESEGERDGRIHSGSKVGFDADVY